MRARMNLVKGVATVIALLILLVLAPGSSLDRAVAQEKAPQSPPGAPNLNAGSWALIDADTGMYLAGKNPDKQVPIASTTKIMLALVALVGIFFAASSSFFILSAAARSACDRLRRC